MARRLLLSAERQHKTVRDAIPIAEAQSATAYDRLLHYTTAHKGVNKPTAVELADALRDYPDSGYDAAVSKQLAEVYSRVIDALVARLNDLATCRRRLEECHAQLVALADAPLPPVNPEHLYPPGCSSVEDAAKRYLASLDDHDLNEAESRFQKRVGEELGGVYEASMNSADGPQRLLRLLRDTTHDYLHERLGEVDLSAMMKAKFGSPSAVAEALDKGYATATPAVSRGPWAKGEICVFGAPSGAGGVGIHHAAGAILPPAATITQTSDEVVIYREWPQVPLASLDQLGPVWEAAYRTAPELTQTTAHTRTDITSWLPVDG